MKSAQNLALPDIVSLYQEGEMIEKVVKKRDLKEFSEVKENLAYWLSKTPEERVGAVEQLRRQRHGDSTDFKKLLALFNAHSVEYLIVGAHALAYYGAPRYTGDLDLLIHPNIENADRVLRALEAFGFGDLSLTREDFTSPNRVVQLGVPPVRIDLVTSITGLSWEEAVAGKELGVYGDAPVSYLGKKEFIRNKRAIGRKKDLADLEALGEE